MGDVYQPTPDKKMIINLPATVEVASANVYADQIEWCHRNFKYRDSIVLSLHTHNDRGTGVAATELGYWPAPTASRAACSATASARAMSTSSPSRSTCTPRASIPSSTSPTSTRSARWSRTATSCRSIRAIPMPATWCSPPSPARTRTRSRRASGVAELEQQVWEIPYLPIDPADLGRSYEAIIRINSQSGKGGIAYILKSDYGIDMPRLLQVEFSKRIQQIADETGKEIMPALIWDTFRNEYLENTTPVDFISHTTVPEPDHPDVRLLDAKVMFNGKEQKISGRGNGPIAGYVDALGKNCGVGIRVRDYHQHATGAGSDAQAVSFIEAETSDGRVLWGVGMDSNIVTASLKAVTSAANRAVAAG